MFELFEIHLPLKYTWKISRSSTDHKTNFIIKYTYNDVSTYGEIAPNIRYGETPDKIKSDFNKFIATYQSNPTQNTDDFILMKEQLNLCHSLQFGLESAFIHHKALTQEKSVFSYFNLPKPNDVYTSYSLPIMEINEIEPFISKLSEYKYLKIKVNNENALDVLNEVKRITDRPLYVDGNEAWTNLEEMIQFVDQIKTHSIAFIEQPMPSSMNDEYVELKKHCPFPLIADESIENSGNFEHLSQQFDGINIKLMKTGGYIRALDLIQKAKSVNMKIMIGCMVETSLGIRSALNLCSMADYVDLDGFLIIKDEPFNLVKMDQGKLLFNEGQIKL